MSNRTSPWPATTLIFLACTLASVPHPASAQSPGDNSPPVIESVTGPPFASAGQSVSLQVTARDRDGRIDRYEYSFAGGPSPVPTDARFEGSTLLFTVPTSVSSAATLEVRLRVVDDQGASASATYELPLHVLSAGGRLHTILGSPTGRLPSRRDVHWVITGDGYAAGEQEKLVADASRLARAVLGADPIAPYDVAWSVHVLEAVSSQSGVDTAPQGRGNDRVHDRRDTIFDGVLGCHDVRDLACVDQHEVLNHVAQAYPDYDYVLVLLNTSRYGGAGGGASQAMVATNHPDAPQAVLHELGHAFAGLADEYDDTNAPGRGDAACSPPRFDEALVPNVTQVSDPAAVKWRHWFADPQDVPRTRGDAKRDDSLVGLFPGAWCHPSGWYRPTWNSVMRTLDAGLGPVNAENWVLQVYRRFGTILAVSPAVGQGAPPIPIDAGSCRTFSVTTPFNTVEPPAGAGDPRFPTIQRVRWFVNGEPRSTAPGEERFIDFCPQAAPGTTYEIRVRVTDATGIVRAPPPNPAYFERTWQAVVR